MARYFMELAYNGKEYHGWQVQPNAISVQEVLDDSLSKILREKIHVVGCGRTDTGVHASYFVAHFESEKEEIEETPFCHKMNRFLSKDIVIYSLSRVKDDTHSRFTAISRTYEYHLVTIKNPFLQGVSYLAHTQLDFNAMNNAAQLLLDYNDFTSFSKLHTEVKTNLCMVTQAKWEYKKDGWIFTIKADRFLRNMVRAVVGTLFDVGRGKMSLDGFRSVIEAKDRSQAGTSAPAEALFLVDVAYPDVLFKRKV